MNGAAPSDWPYPRWISHRGAGRRAPENTLAAFRLGARLGYRMFECDVQVSADGVPFLLHDDTLERTTNAKGLACTHTWAELRSLDAGSWHSPAFVGEPVASLDEVGRFCREGGLFLNLELKPSPGEASRCGHVVAQAVTRDWAGQANWPLLSSFTPEALRAARDVAPHLPRALLLDELLPDSLELAQSLGCVAIVAENRLWTPELMGKVNAYRLHGVTYTVNTAERALELLELGLSGVITDTLLF
jgi:glycerophosphoryl diester phosphodiesterase